MDTKVQMLDNLFKEQRYEEIIFDMECTLLNNGFIDFALLEKLPPLLVESSPLLLKMKGDYFLNKGDLVEAAALLKQAVHGFADQTYQSLLLDTMAQLASVYMRVGELQDGRTLLNFMKQEWEKKEFYVNAAILHVLARGAFLLDEPGTKVNYFKQVRSFLTKENTADISKELWLDLLINDIHNLSELEIERTLLLIGQKAKFDASWNAYYYFAEGLAFSHQEAWDNAAESFTKVETDQLSYEFASICFMKLVELRILSGKQVEADKWNKLERMTKQFETDLNLQLRACGLSYLEALCKGNTEHTLTWRTKLECWADLTQNPLHLEWMEVWEQKGRKFYIDLMIHRETRNVGWSVNCFGKMKFTKIGTEVQDIKLKRKKALELLVFLLIQPGYSSPKERVIETLLQQVNIDQMNNQMYVMIHQLKQTLKQALKEDGVLLVNDGTISLCPNWIGEVDVVKYLSLLRKGDELWKSDRMMAMEMYKQARQIYGEFVPELPYTEWLDSYRESMTERHAGMLRKMAKHCRKQGDYEQAEAYYYQRIEIRPLEEEGYQELIDFLMAADRQLEARRWYGKWEDICRKELGMVPLPDTKKLVFGETPPSGGGKGRG